MLHDLTGHVTSRDTAHAQSSHTGKCRTDTLRIVHIGRVAVWCRVAPHATRRSMPQCAVYVDVPLQNARQRVAPHCTARHRNASGVNERLVLIEHLYRIYDSMMQITFISVMTWMRINLYKYYFIAFTPHRTKLSGHKIC